MIPIDVGYVSRMRFTSGEHLYTALTCNNLLFIIIVRTKFDTIDVEFIATSLEDNSSDLRA
uniref:Uncharacterized protein n=1 Tax=Romanomermis culicivorax TaxID=13658 RepID=A0A915J0T4_ROMCU